jgi:hypothetical protein
MKQKYSEPLGIDVPLGKDKSWHFPAKALGLFIFVGIIFWAGHNYQQPKPKLPANAQCLQANQATKEAAKTFATQLASAIDGIDAPAPDLKAVKNASLECKATQDQVTVKVEAAK